MVSSKVVQDFLHQGYLREIQAVINTKQNLVGYNPYEISTPQKKANGPQLMSDREARNSERKHDTIIEYR